MALRERFDINKFFIALLLIFITIQAGSWFLSQYTDMEMIKAGWILFLFLAVSAIISTFTIGKKFGALKKEDVFFIIFEFLVIVGLFYALPEYIPQIFSSTSLQISETIKESVGAIIKITGTTI